jgi:pimeloyl-ACP methyl ester carboxylesterase
MERLELHVTDSELADLHRRLARTRWPPVIGADDWVPGTPVSWLRDLLGHWREGFDWRAQEERINALPHFRVPIDDVPIHFMHVPGRGPDPMPLVLTHGWPWTFWDFHKVIGPLSDPAAHGGDPADAFHVVVPSLPGFTFSTPLPRPVGLAETARLWTKLMRDVLGYERFAAQGGDWGALVSAHLGHIAPEVVIGVHLSLANLPTVNWRDLGREDFAPEEQPLWDRMQEAKKHVTSHIAVHSFDPQTLAIGLSDSPAGLAAWLIERRRNWSDCGGDVERRFSRDELLTTVMLYWITNSVAGSVRFYQASRGAGWRIEASELPFVRAPTAIAVFPGDVVFIPRALAARHADLRRWTLMPAGGHFAPAEEPAALVEDVRAFFRTLRGGG